MGPDAKNDPVHSIHPGPAHPHSLTAPCSNLKLLFLQRCYKSNSILNFLFVGEVTSQIIAHRTYQHECRKMKRRMQSNVLRMEIEFENTWKVDKVDYDEIGKSDSCQNYPKRKFYL